MRIMVIGSNGMLGHRLVKDLQELNIDVCATYRSHAAYSRTHSFIPIKHIMTSIGVDATEFHTIQHVIDGCNPDVIINCAGVVKQRKSIEDVKNTLQVNSIFPRDLSTLCQRSGIRLIHISTDCVFSGMRGNYNEYSRPDPIDLYGQSKLLGEFNAPRQVVLRTSMIGWQLSDFGGLLSWLASQKGSPRRTIKGYKNAIFTGISVGELSRVIINIATTTIPELQGLHHVASDPINKFELLQMLVEALEWDIHVESDMDFVCDRSLNGSRFREATGWKAPSWDRMIVELAQEWQMYKPIYEKELNP